MPCVHRDWCSWFSLSFKCLFFVFSPRIHKFTWSNYIFTPESKTCMPSPGSMKSMQGMAFEFFKSLTISCHKREFINVALPFSSIKSCRDIGWHNFHVCTYRIKQEILYFCDFWSLHSWSIVKPWSFHNFPRFNPSVINLGVDPCCNAYLSIEFCVSNQHLNTNVYPVLFPGWNGHYFFLFHKPELECTLICSILQNWLNKIGTSIEEDDVARLPNKSVSILS